MKPWWVRQWPIGRRKRMPSGGGIALRWSGCVTVASRFGRPELMLGSARMPVGRRLIVIGNR
jgi:hypothetical protein